jgi:hypothetical protein
MGLNGLKIFEPGFRGIEGEGLRAKKSRAQGFTP